MKYTGTVELETERLILRQFESTDAEAMYNNWASDSEVTKYLMWQAHKSIEESKEYIEYMKSGTYACGILYWTKMVEQGNYF